MPTVAYTSLIRVLRSLEEELYTHECEILRGAADACLLGDEDRRARLDEADELPGLARRERARRRRAARGAARPVPGPDRHHDAQRPGAAHPPRERQAPARRARHPARRARPAGRRLAAAGARRRHAGRADDPGHAGRSGSSRRCPRWRRARPTGCSRAPRACSASTPGSTRTTAGSTAPPARPFGWSRPIGSGGDAEWQRCWRRRRAPPCCPPVRVVPQLAAAAKPIGSGALPGRRAAPPPASTRLEAHALPPHPRPSPVGSASARPQGRRRGVLDGVGDRPGRPYARDGARRRPPPPRPAHGPRPPRLAAVLHAAGRGHARARGVPRPPRRRRAGARGPHHRHRLQRHPARLSPLQRGGAGLPPLRRRRDATPPARPTTSASACTRSRTRCCRRPGWATRPTARPATPRCGPASAASRSCTRPACAERALPEPVGARRGAGARRLPRAARRPRSARACASSSSRCRASCSTCARRSRTAPEPGPGAALRRDRLGPARHRRTRRWRNGATVIALAALVLSLWMAWLVRGGRPQEAHLGTRVDVYPPSGWRGVGGIPVPEGAMSDQSPDPDRPVQDPRARRALARVQVPTGRARHRPARPADPDLRAAGQVRRRAASARACPRTSTRATSSRTACSA